MLEQFQSRFHGTGRNSRYSVMTPNLQATSEDEAMGLVKESRTFVLNPES
jgi:hypothetical protein